MRALFLAIPLLFAVQAMAVYEVGDYVDNMCWKNASGENRCLDNYEGHVRVLLYNAGWCGPCNSEFDELKGKLAQYDGKRVTFLSLSSAGWTNGTQPTPQFLNEWRDKFGLKIPVLASPKDAGKSFIKPPLYIPNVAILDIDGRLAYKAVNPGVPVILQKVNGLLQ